MSLLRNSFRILFIISSLLHVFFSNRLLQIPSLFGQFSCQIAVGIYICAIDVQLYAIYFLRIIENHTDMTFTMLCMPLKYLDSVQLEVPYKVIENKNNGEDYLDILLVYNHGLVDSPQHNHPHHEQVLDWCMFLFSFGHLLHMSLNIECMKTIDCNHRQLKILSMKC